MGHWELGIGNWESGIGNWESGYLRIESLCRVRSAHQRLDIELDPTICVSSILSNAQCPMPNARFPMPYGNLLAINFRVGSLGQ
ncbi:MAG: hypothetical protein F6J93_00675 [Oscillatoria sp. SIO1A7]|nr:hypothetical protein [Oscillatoria sp. SIO1A7]